jgi:Hint domain
MPSFSSSFRDHDDLTDLSSAQVRPCVAELDFKIGGQVKRLAGTTPAYCRKDGIGVGIGSSHRSIAPVKQRSNVVKSDTDLNEEFFNGASFVRGTLIDTLEGPKPVEELSHKDKIFTDSDGPQPLVWIGRRRLGSGVLRGRPNLRPVRITAGVLGNRSDILLSPEHRVLISDWRAQLYFGEDQILVPIKALIDGEGIRCEPADKAVEYFQLVFAHHQVVFSEGLPTESYFLEGGRESKTSKSIQLEVGRTCPEVASGWKQCGFGKTVYPTVDPEIARSIDWVDLA